MAEEGAPTGLSADGPSMPKKVGWYRDRDGQRRFWNGVAWTDLTDAITAFTVESEQTPAPPAPSPVPRQSPIKTRTKLIGVSGAVLVVLATVGAVGAMNSATHRTSTTATVPSRLSPRNATITVPLAATTTTSLAATATAPPATVVGSLGALRPAIGSPSQAGVNVAIIGDSISEFATPAPERVLRHYTLYIDAVGGSKMAAHLATIEQVAGDGLPRDWVIELGTNDALPPPNTNWTSDFANEGAALQGQRCVVFLTVKPTLGSVSTGINDAIANAVATHPNFHSIDWGSIEFRKTKWLLPDALHPSGSGDVELATLVHKAIIGCQGQ